MSTLPGWPFLESPFHAGEAAVQARAGSRERMAEIGPRVIRGVMPQQHREFFPLLPFVVLGAVDASGQPWASWLVGSDAGFVTSPDETHLRIDALPPEGDPLRGLIHDGASLGLLGIELPTRRRNRANGQVLGVDERGFTLQVLQSFGNCPKYIQRREMLPRGAAAAAPAARTSDHLNARAAALVRSADTFFIATHAAGEGPSAGSDVSHRGGRPGFVHVSDDGRTLTWPDFIGNNFFNTLGNLAAEPRAGLVFADFASGDLLHVNGRAEIVWEGPELNRFAGAQRLVRLRVDTVLHRLAALPLRWQFVDASPALAGTGVWT